MDVGNIMVDLTDLILKCLYQQLVCVGGMIGMTMLAGGSDCVIWYKSSDSFPYVGG